MAFTSVDHGREVKSAPEVKGDSGLCAVGLHDPNEVSGGGMEDDSRLFAGLCIAGQRSDLTNPLERFDSGRVGRK